MSGKARRSVRAAAAAMAVMAIALAGLASSGPATLAAPQEQRPPSLSDAPLKFSRASAAMAPLLVKLWNSGFFRRNEAVRGELQSIEYVFFEPNAALDRRALACFVPGKGGRDRIYFRRDIFAHFDIATEGVFESQDLGPRILPILVHEFCHDLWVNVLDEGERAAFAREGEDFVADYFLTMTAEEKLLFLRRAGDGSANLRRMRAYADLDLMRKMYPRAVLCGQELFAWLAQRLFTTKEKIPRPLAKYYVPILRSVSPEGDNGPN